MTASDDERISYLAGEAVESLSASERAELDELRALLATAPAWAEPDPGLEDRVVEAIAQEAGARATPRQAGAPATQEGGTPASGAQPAGAPGAGAPTRRPRFRVPRLALRRPAWALAGVAALAAAVIVVAFVVSNTSPAHEQLAMVVSGTPLAPNAHGSATLTKTESGWRVHLTATGLPHLTGGLYYQAWLRNATGVLVPIGTFNDAVDVTLWAGVPATQYRTLTVTVQRANGSPVSSGRRVLVGVAHAKH